MHLLTWRNETSLWDSAASLGADVAQTRNPFPVITYSTSGLMSAHMTLFEELASHGYVIVCIGHP
ncbi:MAG: hypothetical protein JXA42_22280 [Anaerolineales bacterium]|nr:hypothetical protein [Anaerolineales bacterium]